MCIRDSLTGEQYTCPECGETTEVYSRITGYYRPVQNWNDGKAQEFKDRKVYDLEHSHLKVRVKENDVAEPEGSACIDETGAPRKILFTTRTCPNCVTAKAALEEAHIEYEMVDAKEHADLARKYGIMSAPTLVVIENDGKVEKLVNASNIKKYTEG